jgi:hypothetical protein
LSDGGLLTRTAPRVTTNHATSLRFSETYKAEVRAALANNSDVMALVRAQRAHIAF